MTYDIAAKRVARVMKVCRKYLHHKQKSVFEGTLTNGQLQKLRVELEKIVEVNEDRICIYKLESLRFTSKEELGLRDIEDNVF